jgi:photosystem II stability/assembly factor-like uncharacterized protein/flagellar hook assembly protein FlgD
MRLKTIYPFGIIGMSILFTINISAQKKDEKDKPKPAAPEKPVHLKDETFGALKFRSIGPAVNSGRISDLAIHPKNKSVWYVATASGGLWKTINAGNTFDPIFDNEKSFSIACVKLDPTNSHVVWVGTGENNNQRSVAYGDGVYKSEDDGKSWKNVGLTKSEHIGNIAIHPKNGNVVFVAAYGPLWSAGGERGIYKTTDGGKNWKQVLKVSENTGFNEVHIDKNNPDIMYACAHQRRRHEWTYISGGPESALYKSTDGGETWEKVGGGFPGGELGRIGLAISPVNTDLVYAIVEGKEDVKGFYKSTDRGASWTKQSNWSTTGLYYQEIVADPVDVNRVISMDSYTHITYDGGKTFKQLGEKDKHVDNHVCWIDEDNTAHMIEGCDAGIYETYDNAETWNFKANLPITQFYRVTVDNSLPFYNVYGGTQDNNTLGGPSRTISSSGITNADWFVTVGGDGFKTVIDYVDPNIIYSQWQYGGLIRYDKKSGEVYDIKPVELENEKANRFNWDAPLLISKFDHKRLYFASQKVFRSDDRGNTWKIISGDLSTGIDRNKLPVMGKVWSVDAIAKNSSTSIYGNITALAESPKNEKLIYAGTDDGLVQTTIDGGATWTKTEIFANVPKQTLITQVVASQHDENVVYACFNNHRNGDFKPYLVKSSDKGKTWVSLSNNLPERGSVLSVAEDFKNKNLLFCGTDFGLYFSYDGGSNWIKMSAGLPNIPIKEIAIHEGATDLVLATFGRGFYILDDYSLLQNLKKEDFDKDATIFDAREGLVFIEKSPYGGSGKANQGASFFQTNNPPIGATLTYYLKNDYKTIKEKRQAKEREMVKANKTLSYPSLDSLRLEDNEEKPYVMAIITDAQNNVLSQYKMSARKGMNRFTWGGRAQSTIPTNAESSGSLDGYDFGQLCVPGTYNVSIAVVENGVLKTIAGPKPFTIKALNNATLVEPDKTSLDVFNKDLAEFRRIVTSTETYFQDLSSKIKDIKAAVQNNVTKFTDELATISQLEQMIKANNVKMYGDNSLSKREFETKSGIVGMLNNVVYNLWSTTQAPSTTFKTSLEYAKKEFKSVYDSVKAMDAKIKTIEAKLDAMKVPYTPGRLPVYEGK